MLNKPTITNPCRIGGMVAGGLSNIYLPPLPPPVTPYVPPVQKSSPPPKVSPMTTPRQKNQHRTTLKYVFFFFFMVSPVERVFDMLQIIGIVVCLNINYIPLTCFLVANIVIQSNLL